MAILLNLVKKRCCACGQFKCWRDYVETVIIIIIWCWSDCVQTVLISYLTLKWLCANCAYFVFDAAVIMCVNCAHLHYLMLKWLCANCAYHRIACWTSRNTLKKWHKRSHLDSSVVSLVQPGELLPNDMPLHSSTGLLCCWIIGPCLRGKPYFVSIKWRCYQH